MAYVEIPVGQGGEVALVDKADEALVRCFTWNLYHPEGRRAYAHAWRNRMHFYMHRLIAGAGAGDEVDHINQDGLDNRRLNLRLTTRAQNAANRSADNRKRGKSSRYKGVCWDKSRNTWVAYVHVQGKTRALGRFDTEDAAALAYNTAAEAAWGEYARLNVIGEIGLTVAAPRVTQPS